MLEKSAPSNLRGRLGALLLVRVVGMDINMKTGRKIAEMVVFIAKSEEPFAFLTRCAII